ncbi:MAG: hypothetical protein M3R57_08335 [Chloroflexota bacterium]|nr:hypothetical protein [Chloroflexota bacterium]
MTASLHTAPPGRHMTDTFAWPPLSTGDLTCPQHPSHGDCVGFGLPGVGDGVAGLGVLGFAVGRFVAVADASAIPAELGAVGVTADSPCSDDADVTAAPIVAPPSVREANSDIDGEAAVHAAAIATSSTAAIAR